MEVLTEENINPAFNRVKYDLRGWLEDRAHGIRQELARVSIILDDFDIYPLGVERYVLVGKKEIFLFVFLAWLQRIKLHEILSCK